MDISELIELYDTSNDEFKRKFIDIIVSINDTSKINEFIEKISKNIYDYKLHYGNKGYLYCLVNEMFKHYGNDVYKLGMTKNIKTRLVIQHLL